MFHIIQMALALETNLLNFAQPCLQQQRRWSVNRSLRENRTHQAGLSDAVHDQYQVVSHTDAGFVRSDSLESRPR